MANPLSAPEPRISIKEFKARFQPNDPDFVCDRTVKNWIKKGKIRGGWKPCWFVYADWEPRIQSTGNKYADQALGL